MVDPRLAGMARLAPGVYDDGAGGMHLDVVELLEANGWEASPANIAILESTIDTVASSYGIPADHVHRPETP